MRRFLFLLLLPLLFAWFLLLVRLTQVWTAAGEEVERKRTEAHRQIKSPKPFVAAQGKGDRRQ